MLNWDFLSATCFSRTYSTIQSWPLNIIIFIRAESFQSFKVLQLRQTSGKRGASESLTQSHQHKPSDELCLSAQGFIPPPLLLSSLFDLWSSLRRRRAISLQHCWWPAAKQHGLLSLTYSKAMFIGFEYFISLQGLTYLLPAEDGGLCLMTKCARREWPGQCWAG